MRTKVNTRKLSTYTFIKTGNANSRNASKSLYTSERAKQSLIMQGDKVTLAKTPGARGLTSRPEISLTRPAIYGLQNNAKNEYAGFQTRNPVIRFLKAISKLLFKQ